MTPTQKECFEMTCSEEDHTTHRGWCRKFNPCPCKCTPMKTPTQKEWLEKGKKQFGTIFKIDEQSDVLIPDGDSRSMRERFEHFLTEYAEAIRKEAVEECLEIVKKDWGTGSSQYKALKSLYK